MYLTDGRSSVTIRPRVLYASSSVRTSSVRTTRGCSRAHTRNRASCACSRPRASRPHGRITSGPRHRFYSASTAANEAWSLVPSESMDLRATESQAKVMVSPLHRVPRFASTRSRCGSHSKPSQKDATASLLLAAAAAHFFFVSASHRPLDHTASCPHPMKAKKEDHIASAGKAKKEFSASRYVQHLRLYSIARSAMSGTICLGIFACPR